MVKEMKEKIDQIEELIHDLKKLGQGFPVIEKNAQSMLSFVYILKFGISDAADMI